ncbi:DUF445 family protein [Evansella sp. AB-P1]|uniref:DUF445 domain-containing protein n=1 Tax=Evansella sp. AB-P1 TaxID=3037653 RepID=UPI00241FC273|nr:DUF445 family protein [Evansella sp. AB-P1]MDG5786387.1 DUF445 family protein [Evansella sp. AB-P1]
MDFNALWIVGLMLIGAVLGGGTNLIAIRMLLRPYHAVKIGPFHVPFTPGLIPKRREDIAFQLGKMVEEHLVTPEGISKKIFESSFQKEIEGKFIHIVRSFMNQEGTIDSLLGEHLGDRWSVKQVRDSYERTIKRKIEQVLTENRHKRVGELLSDEWKKQIEGHIPTVSRGLLKKGEEYVNSPEGKEQIDILVSRYFETKGNVGGLFGKMLQRVSPSTLITKELTKLIQDENTNDLLNRLLKNEYENILNKRTDDILSSFVLEEKIEQIVESIIDETPIIGQWNAPVKDWARQYEEVIVKSIFPSIVEVITYVVERNLESVMKKIGIREIVQDQINNFPLEKLETMLLSIAKRELKMIATLGALIGALVGFVQGVIIYIFL